MPRMPPYIYKGLGRRINFHSFSVHFIMFVHLLQSSLLACHVIGVLRKVTSIQLQLPRLFRREHYANELRIQLS